MSMQIIVQRWSGSGWYDTMLSPYKNMSEALQYVSNNSWFFTKEYPYRLKEFKPVAYTEQYTPKYKPSNWNTDDDLSIS